MNCLTCIYSVVLFDLHLFWFTVWSVFILLYCLAWIYSDVLSDLYLFWCTGTVWPVFILMYCLTCIYSDVLFNLHLFWCTVWSVLFWCTVWPVFYSDVLFDLYFILMNCLTPGEAPIALVHRTCIGALVHRGLARPSHKQFAKLFS